MARVTNHARKFFGKRMQKVKVRRWRRRGGRRRKSNRNRKGDDEDEGEDGAAAGDDSDKRTVPVGNRRSEVTSLVQITSNPDLRTLETASYRDPILRSNFREFFSTERGEGARRVIRGSRK